MSAAMFWVGDYVVNSLWMTPLLFFAAWLTARVARRAGARTEHAVWVSALVLQAILPACRVPVGDVLRRIRELPWWHWGGGAASGDGHVSVSMGAVYAQWDLAMPHELTKWLVAAYGCATAYFAARLIWGLWRTAAIARAAHAVELTEETASVWRRFCGDFGIEVAFVAESHEVAGPVTMGVVRDLLVLPSGFLGRVQEGDVATVMAHECAHMRRRDFAKNLLYRMVSLPVTYHPLLWLTLARVTESREMVCDAMAAEMFEGQERYARSLLRLASMVADATPARTLHAIGIFDANTFERRVMRLTGRKVEMGRALRVTTAAACVAMGAVTCASALALRTEVAVTGAAATNQKEKPSAVKVAPGVIAGTVVYQKHPVYPAEAKANHISGAVVMAATISKAGTVKQLEVVSGPEELRASALDAVKEWKYQPYLLNGEPVEVETTITVNYSVGK